MKKNNCNQILPPNNTNWGNNLIKSGSEENSIYSQLEIFLYSTAKLESFGFNCFEISKSSPARSKLFIAYKKV